VITGLSSSIPTSELYPGVRPVSLVMQCCQVHLFLGVDRLGFFLLRERMHRESILATHTPDMYVWF
jgi:hypothetical protein